MPESKTRKAAETKKQVKRDVEVKERRARATAVRMPGQRAWVPPLFITVGLLGVAWLVVYYIAGYRVPYMRDLGNWNILIGMGGMALAFSIATLWK